MKILSNIILTLTFLTLPFLLQAQQETPKTENNKSKKDYPEKLRRIKYRYFRGELTRDELEALGWGQYQGVKPIKNEMDEFLQTDEDLITAQDKLEYLKTVLVQLESILKSLHSRTWDIKNSIEWTKFTNGLM
jgi:hypothetical protein